MARASAAILLTVALAAAISVDVVKTGYGVKGDEATYVSMALSVAYDHDLVYQKRDVERFWGLYRGGPEGIFLKRGSNARFHLSGSAPYILRQTPSQSTDRLYFSKAMAYAIAAAPFVRLFGLNGFLVFHVLLLFVVAVCGYQFLAARSAPGPALAFTLAFLAVAAVPVYAVFLTSDLFNFSLVFVAYFLWAYKEVAPPGGSRALRGFGSDIAAAALLGIATYSKPLNILLIGPLVLLLWHRRRWMQGLVAGVVFGVVMGGLFGLTAWNSGEFNYQGGDRRTFITYFPMETPERTWDELAKDPLHSKPMITEDPDAESVLAPGELPNRFAHNVEYFFLGRHFGFVPYFFPGLVAIALWLFSRERFAVWRILTFLAVAVSAVVILLFFPYTWSGGGGPPGNRYFLNLYPVLFFLVPSVTMAPAMLAWIGGAMFTATMLVNPFWAAKFTYDITARGFARRLPVELTMANDLPINLDRTRSHLHYSNELLLYFLDEHAYPPELAGDDPQAGVWIGGGGRADIIVRAEQPLRHLAMTAWTPINTTLTISAGAAKTQITLVHGQSVAFDVPVSGVHDFNSYAYLLSAQSSDGFIPHLVDPKSDDKRNLGVMLRFEGR